MTASPQAKIAMQMNTRKIRSTPVPSTSRRMKATGAGSSPAAPTLRTARPRATRNTMPRTPDSSTALTIAFGTTRRGSLVSSARLLADSKPTIV
jgi:hypothetical protein